MRIAIAVVLALATIDCGGRLFRQYEYEEEMYLSLDGSAIIYVNSSIPALNALRGATFDERLNARIDRTAVRAYFTTPVTRVTRMPRTSRRNNRQFVHVRIEVDDVRRLGEAGPFAWSSYQFSNDGDVVSYRQSVAAPAGQSVKGPPWTANEIVAFRVHMPSRILFQNTGESPRRGNILVWEQSLAERLEGTPLTLEARMEPQSILYSTLLLFGATLLAVAALFVILISWIVRRGPHKAGGAGRAGEAGRARGAD